MRAIADLVTGLDSALLRAGGVLDNAELVEATQIADRLGARRGFGGGVFVAALAGATGSGKSSLLNALAGEEVASVSESRPHTAQPMAWVPEEAGADLDTLLTELGITERVKNLAMPSVAILDLPDQDSVERSHRLTVERILPLVDVVVWVFDPEKYADRSLHDEFLAPLASYRDQFLFVLNKLDRLGQQAGAVGDALMAELAADGLSPDRYFATAADPPAAAPIGIHELAAHLTERLEAKKAIAGKQLADIRNAVRIIGHRARLLDGARVHFDERWVQARDALVAEVIDLPPDAPLDQALCHLEDFVAAVSVETGRSFGRNVIASFSPTRLKHELEEALATRPPPPEPSKKKKKKKKKRRKDADRVENGPTPIAAELDRRIGTPLREVFWDRAYLAATIASVDVDARQELNRLSL
ncbi:MAG: 50S ribosome-binding GTPase [Acidimicrobiia bacterium]|nr:50S ribosome-binding GTPase [Acidimicrobiia bacterium]